MKRLSYAITYRRRRSLFSSRRLVHRYSRLQDEMAWPSGSGDPWEQQASSRHRHPSSSLAEPDQSLVLGVEQGSGP
jgi:hypothetical protein